MTDRSRLYRTHALILRRRDYGDADRILTILTPERGHLEVIAKGVRKTTSRKAGHLELFTHDSLLLAQARTWDIVTEAVTVEAFRHLREDLDAISRAGYIAELIEAFGESADDPGPLWDLTTFTLREVDAAVATPGIDRDLLLDWFSLRLLSVAGFQPNLATCLQCDEPLQPTVNHLSIAEGGCYCPRCAELLPSRDGVEAIDADSLKVMRFLQNQPWGEARKYHMRQAVLRRVENILHRYLIAILERQLRSVDFLRRMQNDPRFAPGEQ